ncbi:MAG: TrmH family RNA methyltransferase [Candidatus Pacebacteria bacterium]|nr:TrmH family RNA methyltransferase [Candidatus Paceibacterota bacterium]
MKNSAVLILDNIRSTHNVGAIFRTADAVGVSKIYLVGITPAPLDRFGRERADIAKSALGAEKSVKWESVKKILPLLKKLKKEKYTIVAIEQSENSTDYKKVKAKGNTAFILGNEVEGVSKKTLNVCDVVAEIPMAGDKESLNVSVTAGIALFRILNK